MGDDVLIDEIVKGDRERLKIQVREYKGARFIDLRSYVAHEKSAGGFVPTAKGVTLRADHVEPLITALQQAKAALENGG